jgi:NAD(P)-dependent dehydrogenase (short-subunit alcohol dehydrogenase family)
LITVREVVDATLFLASPAASGITGQTVNVCGGILMD